jgi:membrane protease YdiL (CAAX protease family)
VQARQLIQLRTNYPENGDDSRDRVTVHSRASAVLNVLRVRSPRRAEPISTIVVARTPEAGSTPVSFNTALAMWIRAPSMTDSCDPKPALWMRILQFPVTRLILLGGPLFLLMGVSNGFMKELSGTPLKSAAVAAAMAALALAVYFGFVRFVERRSVSELGLAGMGREFGIGLMLGAGLYTLCVLILIVFGMYRIEGLNPWYFVLTAVAMALSSGVFEELLFRGALFRIIEEWLGSWISLVASSLVFGFVHLFNPAGTVIGALYISIEAGLLLAAAYMVTRRLWLSIGFHMAWNYTQSAIFSGIVSGSVSDAGLIRSNIKGPVVLTGGSFGLESSVIAFLLCTTAGVMLLTMAVRRGNIVPPLWKRTG